jgi:hypothetical protein
MGFSGHKSIIQVMLINLPIVGQYFGDAKQYITEYADSTNYKDEFAEQIRLLKEIDEHMKTDGNTKVEENTGTE